MTKLCGALLGASWLALSAPVASAQIELSVGTGAFANRQALGAQTRAALGIAPQTYTRAGSELRLAYRPSARYAVRLGAASILRETNSAVRTETTAYGNAASGSANLNLEGAYYPTPWFSVGAGLGYAFVNSPRFYPQGPRDPAIEARQTALSSRDFLFANLALEGYAGVLTFRLAPTVSLTRVFPDDFTPTGPSGAVAGPAKGTWFGVNATVLVRAPFGKTEYGPAIGFDSLLNRGLAPVVARAPRWGLGVAGQYTIHNLFLRSEDDDYEPQPLQLGLGLLATYRLSDAWRLRGSAGVSRWRDQSTLDSLERLARPEERYAYAGVDLRTGVERRLWRNLYLAAELGPTITYNRRASLVTDLRRPNPGGFTAREQPLARALWFGTAEGFWQAGERLRLGGHVSYTLNNPNGDAVDTRVDPARRRTERWVGGGATAAWMLLRG